LQHINLLVTCPTMSVVLLSNLRTDGRSIAFVVSLPELPEPGWRFHLFTHIGLLVTGPTRKSSIIECLAAEQLQTCCNT